MELGYGGLRLDRNDSPPRKTTFRLEGRLGPPELEMVRQNVEPSLGSGREIEIDLRDLRFLDEHGAQLLRALRERGAVLSNAGGFVKELLRVMETER